ncbi:CelD/BcsL family acetyltransferase involved in cellulose biosynthesis [Mesorhizobium soli]|uniref:GNAT family N-acetyltransferase n=1 Tax=Pseudaminobacter soli (ex Li et al. 2025) TaxID=1295366 RepID=UPI002474D5F0|nr:GNAT family N-acetyltransferase [Mesorhizobium soli]MDH6230488.1 CelD/BcsL family acetyltransferase involved in cellulose biosynthesis [Mesorhizobium soli]
MNSPLSMLVQARGMLWGDFEVETFVQPSDIEREWRQLEASGVATIFQRYDWVDAYVRHVLPHEDARPAIVLGRLDGNPAFILPLAISRVGLARIASWIGGKHSGYNFGLWSPKAAAVMACRPRAEIETMLGSMLEGADCVVLGRTPKIHNGIPQPLSPLQSSTSSTEGYSFDIDGGFGAVLAKGNSGTRTRKIQRRERRMAEAGALQYRMLRDPAQAGAALDFFSEHKALRLADQGQPNSFAEPGVTDFFRELLERSETMQEPLLEMAELSVDGKTRAVIGSGVHNGRVNVYFMTFASDELAAYSPGRVLTFRHIEDSCERGIAAYDLGVGYEDYKTHWCDVIHELDDIYAAFTPIGTATIATIRLGQATKNRMRQNELLWQHLKSAQAYLSRRA